MSVQGWSSCLSRTSSDLSEAKWSHAERISREYCGTEEVGRWEGMPAPVPCFWEGRLGWRVTTCKRYCHICNGGWWMYVGFYQGFPELLSFRSFSQIWVLLRFFEIAMIASFTVRFRVIEEKTWQSTEKTTTGNNWSQSWKPRMRSWNPSTSVRQYAAVTEFFGWHRMTRIAFAFRIPRCFCVILCHSVSSLPNLD